MKQLTTKLRFLDRLEADGLSLDTLTLAAGVEAMLAYYAEERVDGCSLDQDGDMLLFQWGTYDWGDGLAFEVSIVRQLIAAEDEEPQQLDLVFQFMPAAGVSAGEANQWCESPDDLPEFRRFVTESAALKAVGGSLPESVELRFSRT